MNQGLIHGLILQIDSGGGDSSFSESSAQRAWLEPVYIPTINRIIHSDHILN